MMSKIGMKIQQGREIFNNEKQILQILHLQKDSLRRNILIAATHGDNSNSKEKWDKLFS